MDLIKIGKFIATQRKINNFTQLTLAEKLNITDRAVSKWERGKSLPDASIMLELCNLFGITVNELLLGEKIKMNDYNKELEKTLLEMVKQKEESDKRMLRLEIIMGIVSIIPLLVSAIITLIVPMEESLVLLITLTSIIPLLIATPFAIKIEQTAGYYECKECGHRYKPTYSSVLFSQHINRTRYMRCPKCNKKSWQKKVISKE